MLASMRAVLFIWLSFGLGTLLGCKTQTLSGGSQTRPPTQISRADLLTQTRPLENEPTYYRAPTVAEAIEFRRGLSEILSEIDAGIDSPGHLAGSMRHAGLRLQILEGEDPWLVLFEGGESWRGTGTYVFRMGAAREVILQAPHGWHDQHTAQLAFDAFRATSIRALYFNSIHRYRATPQERKRDDIHVADLAHTTDAFFYHASRTALDVLPDSTVIQIHGFDNSRLEVRGIDVVISDGTNDPDPHVEIWRDSFARVFGQDRVAAYPAETQEYGATANTIGRLIRLTNRGRFIHIELSAQLRSDLLGSIEPLVRALRPRDEDE